MTASIVMLSMEVDVEEEEEEASGKDEMCPCNILGKCVMKENWCRWYPKTQDLIQPSWASVQKETSRGLRTRSLREVSSSQLRRELRKTKTRREWSS